MAEIVALWGPRPTRYGSSAGQLPGAHEHNHSIVRALSFVPLARDRRPKIQGLQSAICGPWTPGAFRTFVGTVPRKAGFTTTER
jgi:hypothetical protein